VTKDKLWEIFVARNPSLLSAQVTTTAAGLRKLFDRTWDCAYAQGGNEANMRHTDKQATAAGFEEVFRAFMS